jgi:hypothetical protein
MHRSRFAATRLAALTVGIAVMVEVVAGQAAGSAERAGYKPPAAGTIEVAGYAGSSILNGVSGTVNMTATRVQAARIRTSVAGLAPAAEAPCEENQPVFTIAFSSQKPFSGASATSYLCPAPTGQLSVSIQHRVIWLKPDCALLKAVVSLLRPGKAGFTRRTIHAESSAMHCS